MTARRTRNSVGGPVLAAAVLLVGCARGAPAGQSGPQGVATTAATTASASDWQPVGDALLPGQLMQGVYRIEMPRSDLKVRVGDVEIKSPLSLGSYAAFLGTPQDALVVGDLVLLESEVNPVLSGLQANRIEMTALHRHLLGEQPEVMYMHFQGRGPGTMLAGGLRSALGASATPLRPQQPRPPTSFSFDATRLDQIIGAKGQDRGGVWRYSIGRAKPVTMQGFALPPPSGVSTVLAFQDLGNGLAAINGDYAMTANELNDVLTALRQANIAVQATHQHMLTDEPHIIYTHFYAVAPAEVLARGLKTALDKTDHARSS